MMKIKSIATLMAFVIVVYLIMSLVSMRDKADIINEYQEIDFTHNDLLTKLNVPSHVKKYEWTKEEGMTIKEVFISVDTVLQRPELPQGCEIVALTAVLNTYGYEVTKTKMADLFLPKMQFSFKNGKLYGPNPYKAYAGNPRSEKGFFVYAPPIVEAAKKYLNDTKVMPWDEAYINSKIAPALNTTVDMSNYYNVIHNFFKKW